MSGTTQRVPRPRPRPEAPLRPYARGALVVAWVVLAVGLGLLALRYPSLSGEVPLHFDATGTPDGWGPPAAAWGLAGLWVVLQAALTLLVRVPHVYNYPVAVTEENAPRLYRASQEMLVHVASATAVTFLGVVLLITGDGWAWWLVTLGVVGLLGSTVVGVGRVMSRA